MSLLLQVKFPEALLARLSCDLAGLLLPLSHVVLGT